MTLAKNRVRKLLANFVSQVRRKASARKDGRQLTASLPSLEGSRAARD